MRSLEMVHGGGLTQPLLGHISPWMDQLPEKGWGTTPFKAMDEEHLRHPTVPIGAQRARHLGLFPGERAALDPRMPTECIEGEPGGPMQPPVCLVGPPRGDPCLAILGGPIPRTEMLSGPNE